MSHTPTPWTFHHTVTSRRQRCTLSHETLGAIAFELLPDNAAYIVRAVNAHEVLVAAVEAGLAHVEELRDGWERGAMRECDGRGGTRSNRNTAVETQLRNALAQVEATPTRLRSFNGD
jgi:hypothetical protein